MQFYMIQVASLMYADPFKAKMKSNLAKNLNIIGFVAGSIIWLTYIALKI